MFGWWVEGGVRIGAEFGLVEPRIFGEWRVVEGFGVFGFWGLAVRLDKLYHYGDIMQKRVLKRVQEKREGFMCPAGAVIDTVFFVNRRGILCRGCCVFSFPINGLLEF